MTKIPFATEAYRLDTLPASAQEIRNLYASKIEGESGRGNVLVQHVPGVFGWVGLGPGNIWAMEVLDNYLFVLAGGFPTFTVYRIDTGGVPTALGTVTTGGIPVTLAASANELAICVPPNGWIVSNASAPVPTLTQITSPDFPDVTSVCHVDGYFVWSILGTGQYIISSLLDGLTYSAADIATAESCPDDLVRVMNYRGDLALFGSRSIEFHRNTGNADFPFEPQSGAEIDMGVVNGSVIGRTNDTLCFLGVDLVVYALEGYQRQRISTHALEKDFASWVAPEMAYGFGLSFIGHEQYAITFPWTSVVGDSPGRTFVYDFATKLWHQRSSNDAAEAVRWAIGCAITWVNKCIVGYVNSANIGYLDQNNPTESGVSIRSVGTLPPLWADTGLAFMDRLEVEVETGLQITPFIYMQFSDDGGKTWSVPRARTLGGVGEYRRRAVWHRLGKFRQRMLRFTFTGSARINIYGADVIMRGAKG